MYTFCENLVYSSSSNSCIFCFTLKELDFVAGISLFKFKYFYGGDIVTLEYASRPALNLETLIFMSSECPETNS